MNATNKYVTPVGLQQPAAADLSDGTTGSGAVALAVSPALTGTPTAPTATASTNTTQVATTAFVETAVSPVTDSLNVNGSTVVTPFSITLLVNGIGPVGEVTVNSFPVANRRSCMCEVPGNLANNSQRVVAVVYRNNASHPILVCAYPFSTTTSVTYTASSDSSPSPTTAVAIGISNVSSSPGVELIFIVMPGNYYKIAASSGTINFNHWREFICQNGTITQSSDLAGAGRAVATVYQNTSTSMLFVSAQATGMTAGTILAAFSDSSPVPTNTVDQTIQTSVGTGPNTVWFIVPAGHYYKVTAASGSLSHWYEWTWTIPCTKSQDLNLSTGQGQIRTCSAYSESPNTGAATAASVVPRSWINDPFLVRWVSVQSSNSAVANQCVLRSDNGIPAYRDLSQVYQSTANQARTAQGPVMPGNTYTFVDLTSGTLTNLHWFEYQMG